MRTLICLVATCTVYAAEPITLIGDAGLQHFADPTADWFVAGNAQLSPDNSKLLTSVAGTGVLINGEKGKTKHLITKEKWGDQQIHVEWMVGKNSNSGVYVMGRYEIQVLDSFGKEKPGSGDAGGVYQRWDPKRGKGKAGYEGHPPLVNAAKPAGEWQTYDITFKAPRFAADGTKTSNALFIKVVHNGQVVQENVEVTGPTRSALWEYDPEQPTGPLMLQGDHGPVAYRNITITPLALDQ